MAVAPLPKAVHLIGNLYQVAGARTTHPWDANAYLLLGDEPTLFDCGSPLGVPLLKHNLRELGVGSGQLRRILGTHAHFDHLGGAQQLTFGGQARLALHESAAEVAREADDDRTAAFLYNQKFPRTMVHETLVDGQVLEIGTARVEVLHTPGHTRGCTSYIIEDGGVRVLIAGDTLWGGFHPRIESDMEAWRTSLERLRGERFDLLTFGHLPRAQLLDDTARRMDEACAQLDVLWNPWFKPFDERFTY